MSRKPELSRRSALAAMGAAVLGGCSTESGEEPEPTETETETPNQTETPEEPVDEEQTETEQEKNKEENSSLTWQDILDHEQQYNETLAFNENPDLITKALNGEPLGENYNHQLSNWETSYSHGGQAWDLEHFTSMDLDNVDDFQDIMNDAITLGIHHESEQSDYQPSGASGNAARTAQLLINNLIEQGEFEDHNLHLFGAGNDNHGFAYALSEQHGLYLIDSTSERSGKSGAGALSDRAGYDRIKKYDSDNIQNERYNGISISNFTTDQLYSIGGPEKRNVRYNLDLLPEAMEIFDTTQTDNGEILMNTLRPAVATLTHEYIQEEFEVGEDIIMINPDSLYDLPDFREYGEDNFEEYREELNQYTERIDREDAEGKVFPE